VAPGKFAWPIADRTDLKKAIQSFGRAAGSAGVAKVKSWIVKRARELGAVSMLPPSWGIRRSAQMLPFSQTAAALDQLPAGQLIGREHERHRRAVVAHEWDDGSPAGLMWVHRFAEEMGVAHG
jgi:hypothetical protein